MIYAAVIHILCVVNVFVCHQTAKAESRKYRSHIYVLSGLEVALRNSSPNKKPKNVSREVIILSNYHDYSIFPLIEKNPGPDDTPLKSVNSLPSVSTDIKLDIFHHWVFHEKGL